MNVAMAELLQLLGSKDVEIYLLRKQLEEMAAQLPKPVEAPKE